MSAENVNQFQASVVAFSREWMDKGMVSPGEVISVMESIKLDVYFNLREKAILAKMKASQKMIITPEVLG